jgi:hypothetical protein
MENRAYFFTNMYISDIQRGIQSAHCISDMHVKYKNHGNDLLDKWAKYDKTMIVLNGGYSSHLKELCEIFCKNKIFPWKYFQESEEALDGALTCVGIILPEYIYESSQLYRTLSDEDRFEMLRCDIGYKGDMYENTQLVSWLIENLGNYRLA